MIGSYYHIKESVVEKLHPLTKIIILMLVIISTIYIDKLTPVLILAGMVFFYIILAKLLKELSLFILFYGISASIMIAILFLISGQTLQLEVAIIIFAKLFSHIFCGLVLAFTTAPRKMAAALNVLKMPQIFLFIFILALRLFPLIIKEYQYIIDSLRLRNQSVVKIMLFNPGLVIFPIMVRTVKLSDELSLSAETRGFSIQDIKLPFQPVKFSVLDLIFMLVSVGVVVLLTLMEYGYA